MLQMLIGTLLARFGSELMKLMFQLVTGTAGIVIERTYLMAKEIVRDLETTDLTGPEKRTAAFDRLKVKLRAEVGEVSTLVMNFAIESAVASLKVLSGAASVLAEPPPK